MIIINVAMTKLLKEINRWSIATLRHRHRREVKKLKKMREVDDNKEDDINLQERRTEK